MEEKDSRLLFIAIGCLVIAGLTYATLVADPPLIEVPVSEVVEDQLVKSEKVDPQLHKKFAGSPHQKVRMFVSLKNNQSLKQLKNSSIELKDKGNHSSWAVVEGDYEELNRLIDSPGVSKVHYDQKVRAVGVTDSLNSISSFPKVQDANWNLENIDADEVHASNYTGNSSVVVVLDTGVNHDLEDLDDTYLGGRDLVYSDSDPDDVYGHGTKTTAILTGEGDGKYTGVAPGSKYYHLKVLNDEGWGNWSDIAEGLEWCIDHSNEIDLVSMSLGAGEAPINIKDLCAQLHNDGVILVAASGNEGMDVSIYPARYDTVISVGAVGIDGRVASFSNAGSLVAAPGVQVPILNKDGSLLFGDGTSFACPHVAGVMALIEGEKDITHSQAVTVIEHTTTEITDPSDKVKYGQVNAVNSVNYALNEELVGDDRWFTFIHETWAKILVGLIILLGGLKLYLKKFEEV